jgi:hypothetical protein
MQTHEWIVEKCMKNIETNWLNHYFRNEFINFDAKKKVWYVKTRNFAAPICTASLMNKRQVDCSRIMGEKLSYESINATILESLSLTMSGKWNLRFFRLNFNRFGWNFSWISANFNEISVVFNKNSTFKTECSANSEVEILKSGCFTKIRKN